MGQRMCFCMKEDLYPKIEIDEVMLSRDNSTYLRSSDIYQRNQFQQSLLKTFGKKCTQYKMTLDDDQDLYKTIHTISCDAE